MEKELLKLTVDNELLDEINKYMQSDNNHLVKTMSEDGLSAPAILLILQSIYDGIKNVRALLKKETEIEND